MPSRSQTLALINSLKFDKEVDDRVIQILEYLFERDDEVSQEIVKTASFLASKTKVIPVEHLATDFTAIGGMTWAVTLAQLQSFTFSVQDDMAEATIRIHESTLGGVASNEVNINIPGGLAIAGNPARPDQWFGTGDWTDPGGSGPALVVASALTPTVIKVFKIGLANFALGLFTIHIQIRFAIGNAIYKSA